MAVPFTDPSPALPQPLTPSSGKSFKAKEEPSRTMGIAVCNFEILLSLCIVLIPRNDAFCIAPSVAVHRAQVASKSSQLSVLYKPAMEHTQPLWGPTDPYLAAGKSIGPSASALADLVPTGTKSTADWPEVAQQAVKSGVHVLDASDLHAEAILPGFMRVGGILAEHNVPAETPATFAAQVGWASGFMNVMEKLPEAALAYAMIEFFVLRPNLDMYKEDVEEEPVRAFADFVAVSGVRLSMFCVVAVVTTGLFG